MGKGSSKLPDAGEVPAGLDSTLLQQLPEELKSQVIGQYKEFKGQYDELQSSYERLRVDSEQRYFELERNSVTCNERLESETRSAQELRQTVENLEQKVKESAIQINELRSKKDDAEATLRELESARCNLEVEKGDLAQALDRKNHEIDRLNEEWKEMSEKLSKNNQERVEALALKDQVETQIVTIQHREQRLQQENGLLQQQNTWFDQELKAKISDMLNMRKDQSGRLLEIEAQLEQRSEELRHSEEMVESLKETNEEQSKKIESYCEKLRELRDMQTQQEEQHRSQVQSQTNLIKLYEKSANDSDAQVKELTSAVTELQKLMKDASQAYTELEKEKQDKIDELVGLIRNKGEEIDRLEKELQHANELLEVARKKTAVSLTEEAIEALSPSAAAASRLLKSGMTLTQIYSEYVKTSEQLLLEKQENERLQQYLDRILEEIEEKAPLMKKQREDYEKSITVIEQLTRQLDSARCEEEKLRVESDEGRRKVLHFTRENQRFKQQTVDLGQQVRMLLKELEEARGTLVSTDISMDADISVAEVSSSSHVISEKLVTFRGIEELQKKNQELIAALRTLSDEREEAEKMAMDARTAELKRQLDSVTEELSMMRGARDRQVSMVESLVRQRDMYRVLLSESGSTPLPAAPSPQTSTPRPAQPSQPAQSPIPERPTAGSSAEDQKKLAEKTAALKELMEEFNQYREEKSKNEKILTEQIETQRKQASDMRVQNARIASQLDFAGERTKVLQNNAEAYKKEIAALRDKNQKYSASVIRHEQTINSLKEDLFGVKERLARAEVVSENMRVERNMLKSVEARLLQEKENILREQGSQKLLLANLQAIQNNLERADFENKTRLNQRIEMLEMENAGLKNKLDGIDSQHRGIMGTLERQIADVQNESERRLQTLQTTKEQLTAAEQKVQTTQEQLSQLQTELEKTKAEAVRRPPVQKETIQQSRSVEDDEIKHLRNQVDTLTAEIKNLKSQLQQARQHTAQYKTIADDIEHTLKEQTASSEQFKETAEAQLKDAREGNERIEKQLIQVEKDKQNLINENFRLTENYHKTNAELQKQLQMLQSEMEEAVTQRETAIGNEQAARADHANQARLAQEAQDKYERELILHAADVEALTSVKQQLEGFNQRLLAAEEEARDAKSVLETSKSGWSGQEKMFKDEENKLKARISDLQEQNRMVHEEMEAMSEQVMTIQNRREQEQHQAAALVEEVTSDASTERSTDQLVEVIRFLRKEKEIAEARLEVTQAENTRVKQRTEYLDQQLEETNSALAEERQNAQVNLATAAQHMELMRKVDNLNLVTESNKLLRGERDQLATQLREVETKAKRLEDEITPLQASQRELASERDALTAEKVALTAEVQRWRARTNHLIEQCNKTDPEEHKRLLQERETLRKQLNTTTEETHKLRAEISRLNSNIVKLEGDLTSQKTETQTIKVASEKLKTSFDEKVKESEDKMGTINQLRKLGRKYKVQVEQVTAECNKVKAELEKGQGGNMAALEEKLKKTEKELEAVTEKLGSSDFEKNEATKAAKEQENQCKALQEALDKVNEEVKKVTENEAKLEAANKGLQEQITKLNEEIKKHKEAEGKQQQLRNTIGTAKTKLLDQKKQIEKLTAESTELKEKVATLQQSSGEANAKKAAYESRIGTLEREMGQLRNALAAAQAEGQQVSQLQQKITMLQKQLDSQPKPQQAGAAKKPTGSAPPVASRQHVPKPMGAGTTPSRPVQPFTVQPVRRPVAPTPPTATVMPTTSISTHEGEMASPSSQVRPTPPVQTVSPHIETETQATSETTETEPTETPPEPTPSTSTGRETGPPGPHGAAPKRTRDAAEGSDTEQEGPVKRPKTQVTQVQDRTDGEASAAGPEVAAREAEPVESTVEIQQSQQEESQPREVGLVEPAAQVQEPSPSSSAGEPRAASVEPKTVVVEPKTAQPAGAPHTVIVLDDEEEEEGEVEEGQGYDENQEEYIGDEEEEEEDEGEPMPDYEDDEREEEELDEDREDDDNEEYDEQDEEEYADEENEEDGMEEDPNSGDVEMSEEEGLDSQDIVIVDDDTNEAPMESQEEEQQPVQDQPMGTQEAPQVPPRLRVSRIQQRAEPSPSTSHAQQLPPFLLQPQMSQCEEDDSIVPSTPTLVIPKAGTDQVAISSPQVPQGRFLFGSGLPPEPSGMVQSDLAQLASQGGVDDTRMDLSQFDDAAGRSVPTTPRSRTPPTISITEAPPQEGEEEGVTVTAEGATAWGEAGDGADQATTEASRDKTAEAEANKDSENVAEVVEGDTGEESRPEARGDTPTPSTSQEGQMEEGQGEASQQEDSDAGQGHAQEEKPGPSSPAADKPEQGTVRPKKIQRIVWDQPTTRKFSRGARGARGQSAQRGQPVQRMGGAPAGNYGQMPQMQQQQQQQQQQSPMGRGNMMSSRARAARGQRSRRSRPF